MLEHPRFDTVDRAWRAIPYAELHATGDRDLYNEQGQGWPVWKGRTFERYRPDMALPVYWAEPEAVLARLQEKRLRSRSVFGEFSADVLTDLRTLPPYDCRIVFRDVVRATDRRTMRSCLAPPRIFAIHDAPQLIWPRGEPRDQMYVLSVFNSLPFDWLLRRRVETHVTFGILNALPIPESPAQAERLSDLASRLSCTDDRYADFAQRVGVNVRPLTDPERVDIEAKIDALVAHAYGLTRQHLDVIFADFVEAAVPASYREAVIRHYEAATP
jgi:hypothetical protein